MKEKNTNKIFELVTKAVSVAMSVAVVVLNILNQIEVKESLIMLGIGLFLISLSNLSTKK